MDAHGTDHRETDFEGLRIGWDQRVLEPRPWTAAQSRWVAELSAEAPEGPVLELCCGAGHIGLLAARLTGRDLVQVDRERAAVDHARRNAAAAGVVADVRQAAVEAALADTETFGLVIVDPPWLRTDELGRFPEDPVGAVDGGQDGLTAIRTCLAAGRAHTAHGGHMVVQVGTEEQAAVVVELATGDPEDGWQAGGTRVVRPGGVLVHLARSAVPGRP